MFGATQNHSHVWISLHDAAEYLSVCYHTVWRAVDSGDLEAKRCGKRAWRTTRAACDRFMGIDTPVEPEQREPIELPPGQLALLENLQRRGISLNGGHPAWQQLRNKRQRPA